MVLVRPWIKLVKGPTLSKNEKIRVSVTMTRTYVESLNQLVEDGIYLNRGDIILEALRVLFRSYGIEPFSVTLVEEDVEKSG